MSTFSQVPASEWEKWVAANEATVLDIREPHEWALGTLPDAVLISQRQLMDRMHEIPKDRPVLCVCRSGNRSASVALFLSFNEYEAANMAGGMKALGMQD